MKLSLASLLLALAGACGNRGGTAEPSPSGRPTASPAEAPAIDALVRGDFTAAGRAADDLLARRPDAPRAAAVRAVARYQAAGVTLFSRLAGLEAAFEDRDEARLDRELVAALGEADRALAAVDADLAIAAADPTFALELCPACWAYDWTLDQRIDERDHHMLEIEYDARGAELPDGDPRRRPTFRLDHGDVLWARAMISFQRALLHAGMAYRWSALAAAARGPEPSVLRVPLADGAQLGQARDLALAALDHAEGCRQAYLAETDDDREWVPNPRQKSHPVPLEVDAALYETWGGALADLRGLLRGETGVPLGPLVALVPGYRGPTELGYLDVGALFAHPRDLVVDLAALEELERSRGGSDAGPALRRFFGGLWRERMTASPIVGRMRAARESLERGEQTLDRKLRYLFWFN
jgi:hypothetical protein